MNGSKRRQRAWVGGLVAAALVIGAVVALRVALETVRSRVADALGPGAEVGAITAGLRAVDVAGVRLPGSKDWPAADLLRAERITIVPALRTLFSDSVVLRSVTLEKPYVSVLRTDDAGLIVVPTLLEDDEDEARDADAAERKVVIRRLIVDDGEVELFDATVSRPPWRIHLADVDATVEDVTAPELAERMPFEVRAKLRGPRRNGQVAASGWVHGATQDVEVDAALQAVDLLALQPYLVQSTKARLSGGTLDLSLDARVRQRRLHAPGHLVLADLVFAPGVGPAQRVMGVPRDVLLRALAAGDGRIELDFTLSGDVDDPRFSLNEALGTQIASAMVATLGVSVRGLVEGVGEIGGEVVGGAEKATKGIGSALKGLLERRP